MSSWRVLFFPPGAESYKYVNVFDIKSALLFLHILLIMLLHSLNVLNWPCRLFNKYNTLYLTIHPSVLSSLPLRLLEHMIGSTRLLSHNIRSQDKASILHSSSLLLSVYATQKKNLTNDGSEFLNIPTLHAKHYSQVVLDTSFVNELILGRNVCQNVQLINHPGS